MFEDEGYGQGAEPQGQPATPHARRAPGDRTDGITKLQGDVSFATDGKVGIDLTVDGGTVAGTSDFKATGARGDGIPPNPTERTASLTSQKRGNGTVYKVKSSNLPQATAGSDYTVQVSYKLNTASTRKTLEGTVARGSVVFGTTAKGVSLT